jgi:N4-gp56 family major capsid protein
MATTTTATSGFSDLVQELVSARAAEELRARAVHAMPGLYVPARFIKGTNTLRYARYADLGVNTTPLTEGTPPTDGELSISSEFFTAAQYGATVAVSDLAQIDSPHDLISIAAERIAYQATRSMDVLVRDNIHANVLTSAVFGATGATTLTANTANSAVATAGVLTGAFVKNMVARLKGSNVPQFADGTYRCIIHPSQEYDLVSDTSVNGWIEANKYVNNIPLLTNEIGMFAGVRFIVSSDAKVYSTAGASSGNVYTALFLGPDAYTIGDSQTLQSYFVAPGGDHTDPLAQKALVGYKMRFGSLLLDNAGARYRVLKTQATVAV